MTDELRLIVFDMDGTLVDSADVIVTLMQETFTGRGLPVPSALDIRRSVGLSLEVAMEFLSGQKGDMPHILAEDFRRFAHIQHERGHEDHILFPGALETIRSLSADPFTLLGVATGKEMKGLQRVLDRHQIAGHFATLQTPDRNPSKPHPGMMLSAMSETGAEAHRTLMIGDTSYDMQTARAAGGRAIGVSWGYHGRDDLLDAGADLVVDRYDQIADAIHTILEASHA